MQSMNTNLTVCFSDIKSWFFHPDDTGQFNESFCWSRWVAVTNDLGEILICFIFICNSKSISCWLMNGKTPALNWKAILCNVTSASSRFLISCWFYKIFMFRWFEFWLGIFRILNWSILVRLKLIVAYYADITDHRKRLNVLKLHLRIMAAAASITP